ncbi:MAG: hypothetical protein KME47_19060 [Nodosilinea sp. WJT8-NPBG4]|jgi:uncharacterized tellurite resistance protein B-like protein|nr:hypothetical protein [Nodosilinea sp. WJT8-NPBG4]
MSSPSQPGCPITDLVSQFIRARAITKTQYQELTTLVLADGTIDESERKQVNRLFDAIQLGRVKILD